MSRKPRACKHCGCTNRRACFGLLTGPCCWVLADECSACRPDLLIQKLARPPRRRRRVNLSKLKASVRRLEKELITKPGKRK